MHAYVTTPHAATGFSPYYLVFGQECTDFLEVSLMPQDFRPLKQQDWNKFREELIARLEINRMAANRKVLTGMEKLVDPNRPLREYRQGDRVRIKNYVKNARTGKVFKWRPQYLGPYIIKARKGPTEYTVHHENNSADTRNYNVDDIKPYRQSALRSQLFTSTCPKTAQLIPHPENIATEEEVEQILDHKEVQGQRHYLIKYYNKDAAFNQWIPEPFTMCPEMIKSYHQRLARTRPAPPLPTTPAAPPAKKQKYEAPKRIYKPGPNNTVPPHPTGPLTKFTPSSVVPKVRPQTAAPAASSFTTTQPGQFPSTFRHPAELSTLRIQKLIRRTLYNR